jgi:hypothetical protein
MESLEQGVDSPGLSRRRWVVGLIAVVVLGAVGAAAWQVDMRWREASASDIALAFDEALSAIETAERRVQSVSEYARPQSDRDDISLAEKASLGAMVQEAAVDSAAEIAAQRSRVVAAGGAWSCRRLARPACERHRHARSDGTSDVRAARGDRFCACGSARGLGSNQPCGVTALGLP